MLLAWLLVLSSPAAQRPDCRQAAPSCPPGVTGPACDLPCAAAACDFARYCHDGGDTYGLAAFGARLFALAPDAPDWLVRLQLLRFIVDHPHDLGLAPDLRARDLVLPSGPIDRVEAGALRLLRLPQRYREWPVFGADATLTLIADRTGVIGLRGAVVDGREDYAFVAAPAGREVAAASVRSHAAARTGLAAEALRPVRLRLVAFPRARALAWAAAVFHGAARVADVVVAADPRAEILPLLAFTEPSAAGLGDALAFEVRAEDLDGDIFTAPIQTVRLPTTGSLADGSVRLADEQVVLIDAAGAATRAEALASPIYGELGGEFDAYPDSREYGLQNSYYLLRSYYAHTDAVMHGRWDSALPTLGLDSVTPAGQFAPRLVVAADPAASLCGAEASWCVSSAWAGATDDPPEALQHPLGAGPHEIVGAMYLAGANFSPSVLPHEFGHFVDLFAAPGLMFEPFVCMACGLDCHPGTTDDALPLSETYASLMALWFYRSLYPAAGQADSCATLTRLSLGENRNPHSAACRPGGAEFSRFVADDDPACPDSDGNYPDRCDLPSQIDIDFEEGTGLCDREVGYGIDSWFQAFWELLHGERCATAPPYECTPLPALAAAPAADAIGGALLYAAQVSSGTYRGFADDVATYVACNHGEAAYLELNEVLCHHHIRPCEAPMPARCEFCGDGLRSGGEACDGGDLGGQTCEGLGLGPGALSCDASCGLVSDGCMSPETGESPTTGGDEAPTTGATGEASGTSGTSGDGAAFIAPPATGGEQSEDGCSCTSGPAASWWLAALALARRRRRADG
ncbi:hypothetical protein SAMN02745121_01502 [Nannocystis exedens]|uniref:MYXO-CTERM domain-containing protein n=1 Tax=Nannocystis exedens TaxID=54 RepID=A0A1I1V2I5_9BACT|nr:hypothetical protein [Nannocystis exedens]PCC72300.1 hypothetical protein NAEX_05379 [Nannocystis exedens]SFD77226.1 hypothetical protein SAMN02745121_01502 [Nannocystis exedens]